VKESEPFHSPEGGRVAKILWIALGVEKERKEEVKLRSASRHDTLCQDLRLKSFASSFAVELSDQKTKPKHMTSPEARAAEEN
jgi:hypothetical protein